MNILHVISDLKLGSGGPPKATLEMCQGLAQEGHQVHLYTTNLADEGILDVPLKKSVNVGGISISYFSYGIFRKWPVSIALARAIRKNIRNFDIVEIHSLYMFHSLITAYFCRKYRIPYIIRPHGSLDPFIRKKGRLKKGVYHFLIEDSNLNHAAAIQYTAEEEKSLAHDQLGIKSPSIVIPLGVNLSDFADVPSQGSFLSKYPELVDKQIILFLSRINYKKGLDLLAQAFGQVAAVRPDARLVIAGPEDPGYGDAVRRWLADAGVLDKVIFTGMLRGFDKLAAFVDADMFVLPSYSENFGIAIVEAMACGLPVITTDKVNIWRDISQAEAGEIIHCDTGELRDSIIKLIDNPDLRKKYGANGQKLVGEKFRWDRLSKQLVNEYQLILDRTRKV